MKKILGALVAFGLVAGCATERSVSEGNDDFVSPSQSREPVETVPAEPPGPAEPLPASPEGGVPSPTR
jgi:hypothetical protein